MKPIVGITMGDPAGIGSEIVIKTLGKKTVYEKCIPIVIGDKQALEEAVSFCDSNLVLRKLEQTEDATGEFGFLEYIDLGLLRPGSFEYKKVQKICGEAAFQYIVKGIELAMQGKLHAVITGPTNKEAINLAGHHYSGQTEIFADYTKTKDYAMVLMCDSLKVIHVTTHCSVRDACDRIKKERILTVIKLADQGLRLMGYKTPRIGVAGLNPHSSENGLFGWEEEKEIIPAIQEAREMGINAEGPVPPDTVFVKCMGGQYDIVTAMYHDQGHIPLKLIGFKIDPATNLFSSVSGVNCTIGLPIIRTSVDHGTAFDKAGEGEANEDSLEDAINVGISMAKNKFSL